MMKEKLSIFFSIKFFLLIALLWGIFLRFYNLGWGNGYFFHPDERNLGYLITESHTLSFSSFISKGTFSYGNFFTNVIILTQKIIPSSDLFSSAILLLRFQSAFFSLLTSVGVLLSGALFSKRIGIFAFLLSLFSIGLVQVGHFGMFDSFITCCLTFSFYFLGKYIQIKKFSFVLLSMISILFAGTLKINSLLYILIPLFIFWMYDTSKKKLIYFIPFIILPFILSPYYLTSQFLSALEYEKNVITGSPDIFYTQSFVNTSPITFQLFHIYPFLLNPFIVILFIFSFLCIHHDKKYTLLNVTLFVYFLFSFLPNSFLFAKWTRYMIPTLPFIYIIVSISLDSLQVYFKKNLKFFYGLYCFFVIVSFLYTFFYIFSVFMQTDTRVNAFKWTQKNIPPQSSLLTEQYDLGIQPFQEYFPFISFFNFYELDKDHLRENELKNLQKKADYIIIPSQRLIRARLLNKAVFPLTYKFYKNLLNQKEYLLIYKTPCDFFCMLVYMNDPIFQFEETATVFDRPTVLIFKKIR